MELAGKQVLVTGGAGQLGEEVVKLLLGTGAQVTVLDREPGRSPRVTELIHSGCVRGIEVDLTCRTDLEEHAAELAASEQVVHLASVVEPGLQLDASTVAGIELNVLGTLNLLEYLPNCRFFCFASSMMVYGTPVHSPMDENHPTCPENAYGIDKLTVEKLLLHYSKSLGRPVAILRFTSLFGPGRYSPLSRNRAIPHFIRRVQAGQAPVVYGEGKEKRDYLFIRDAATAVVLVLKAQRAGIFNVGSGQGVSIKELAELIVRLSGKKVAIDFRPGVAEREVDYALDIGKIRAELGFSPRWGLAEGLAEEIRWYQETGID